MSLELRVKGSFSSVKRSFQFGNDLTKSETLGNRLAKARLELGAKRGRFVSQADLAAMVDLTGASVGNYEAGRTEPSYAILERLAKVLGVAPGWLAFGNSTGKHTGLPTDVDDEVPVTLPAQKKRRHG